MSRIVIELGRGRRIGWIEQDPGGGLTVVASDESLRTELADALRDLVGQPQLRRGGGVRTDSAGGKVFVTTAAMVAPGDDGYLRALADAIARKGASIRGTRLRGSIERDADAASPEGAVT